MCCEGPASKTEPGVNEESGDEHEVPECGVADKVCREVGGLSRGTRGEEEELGPEE
jgi:hypothetical protein